MISRPASSGDTTVDDLNKRLTGYASDPGSAWEAIRSWHDAKPGTDAYSYSLKIDAVLNEAASTLARLASENYSLRRSVTDHKAELSSANTRITALVRETHCLGAELAKARDALTEAGSELSRAQVEIARLREQSRTRPGAAPSSPPDVYASIGRALVRAMDGQGVTMVLNGGENAL
jgi:septal ring factor EnvC (AmiA/AmiB activator)